VSDPSSHPALLPAGLRDVLPPEAETAAAAVEAIMEVFATHGYQRVKPPLLEFEDSLLTGSGAAIADQTFRLMDPDSRRMLGLRADTTPQVARIAATRLASVPRPLRLSYAGQCLRVQGTQLAPDRQVAQAGIELIGPDVPEADAEVICVGAEALHVVGLTHASFDLAMPTLAAILLDELGLAPHDRQQLDRALDRKDVASVTSLAGPMAKTLVALLRAAGPAHQAMAALQVAGLPTVARSAVERLEATVAAIRRRAGSLRLTLDPLEFRGLQYHTGIAVTVYALACNEELGRGGRYLAGEAEAATGITLYPDAILRAAPARPVRARCFVPFGQDGTVARRAGFASVAALFPLDAQAEARRLGCSHVVRDGAVVPLED
jgi:ATP phosphoribosyltransferase regulatory subunit